MSSAEVVSIRPQHQDAERVLQLGTDSSSPRHYNRSFASKFRIFWRKALLQFLK
jgi:hypothetical protein